MAAEVRFFITSFGARIAYATHGEGPALVYIPPLTSHIEVLWEEPSFRAFYDLLATRFTLVRYDRYGCGLSDRDRTDFRWQVDVGVLGELLDHLRLPQVALFGQSAGGTIAIRYALARPERVAHLLLWGVSWEHRPNAVHAAVNQLIRADWRMGANAFADFLLPTARPDARRAFARVMRESATGDMMAGLRESGAARGLAAALPDLSTPTLVLAARDDQFSPLTSAVGLAGRIAGARLVVLAGDCYVAEFGDIAAIARAIVAFTGVPPLPDCATAPPSWPCTPAEAPRLSTREGEVLRLVAQGLTDAEVADRLHLSRRTVGTHLSSIYAKLGVATRTAAARLALERHLA